jgi:hypothetical protein
MKDDRIEDDHRWGVRRYVPGTMFLTDGTPHAGPTVKCLSPQLPIVQPHEVHDQGPSPVRAYVLAYGTTSAPPSQQMLT